LTHTRGKLTGVAVAALLSLAIAGCGDMTGGAAAPAKPADPKAALAASTSGLEAGNYSFTATMPGYRTNGVVHLPSHTAAFENEETDRGRHGRMRVRLIGHHEYVALTGEISQPLKGKTWTAYDLTKLKPEKRQFTLDNPDLTGATELVAGAITAARTGSTITGTLNATGLHRNVASFENTELTALGSKAESLPYEATLDDRGRLIRLELDAPAFNREPASRWSLQITGYGAAAPQPAPPKADVFTKPDDYYEMRNL
jgi:hypothetical protein